MVSGLEGVIATFGGDGLDAYATLLLDAMRGVEDAAHVQEFRAAIQQLVQHISVRASKHAVLAQTVKGCVLLAPPVKPAEVMLALPALKDVKESVVRALVELGMNKPFNYKRRKEGDAHVIPEEERAQWGWFSTDSVHEFINYLLEPEVQTTPRCWRSRTSRSDSGGSPPSTT